MYKILLFIFIISVTFIFIGFNGVKGNEKVKIVTLGDSITYGVGDPEKKGYVYRLKERYEKQRDVDVDINNYGIPRYRTSHVLEQLKVQNIKEQIRTADYIILFIGTNDLRKSAEYEFETINETSLRLGRAIYVQNVNKILSKIRSLNVKAPVLVLGLYNPYNYEFGHVIKRWNISLHHITNSFKNVVFVPTVDLLNKKEYFADSLHPNEDGYDLISNRVFKSMTKLEEDLLKLRK